jgi:hypothetical protein
MCPSHVGGRGEDRGDRRRALRAALPPFVTAVLAGPAGAVFSVSRPSA